MNADEYNNYLKEVQSFYEIMEDESQDENTRLDAAETILDLVPPVDMEITWQK